MTNLPPDQILTRDGLAPDQGGRVLLIACGALAREIVALRDMNGWTHMDLTCLPAIFHNHPERIVPGVEAAVEKHQRDYDQIFVVYADCGTGGQLQAACDRLGVSMVKGPHCYAFYDGLDHFAARDEITSFYLTDFLARQFDAFVWKPLGLEKHPELLEMYFGNYEKLVYLAQVEDADLDARAEALASRLGLDYERRFTGYGDLSAALAPLG